MANTALKPQLVHSTSTVKRDVEARLMRAFPEIKLDRLAKARGMVNNHHNLNEKWQSTVRSVEYWVAMAEQAGM